MDSECVNCDDLARENRELRAQLAAAEAAWERAKLDAAGAAKRALIAEAARSTVDR